MINKEGIGTIDPADNRRLADLIRSSLGFDYPEERWPDMLRHIKTLAETSGFMNINSCIQWLLAEGAEAERLDSLVRHITVGETYFFRDKEIFSLLQNVIFPALLKEKRTCLEQKITIWSAGCSSGEEPYSIAIAAAQTPGLSASNISIIASDINKTLLAKAQKGVYRSWSFRSPPSYLLAKYFSQLSSSKFELAPAIREQVRFFNINLVAPVYSHPLDCPGQVDIIFCRNVLMYFDPKIREAIVHHLTTLLAAKGWLIVSPSETAVIEHSHLMRTRINDIYFFQKTSPGEAKGLLCPSLQFLAEKIEYAPVNKKSEPVRLLPTVTAQLKQQRKTDDSGQNLTETVKKSLAAAAVGPQEQTVQLQENLFGQSRSWDGTTSKQEVLCRLAALFGDRGEFDRAEEKWLEAIEEDKLNPQPYYHLALTLQEMNRYQESLQYLKKVLFLDPDCLMAYVQLAMVVANQRDAQKFTRIALSLVERMTPQTKVPLSGGMTVGMIKKTLNHIEKGQYD